MRLTRHSSRRPTVVLEAVALAVTLTACTLTTPDRTTGTDSTQMDQRHYQEHVTAKSEIETLYSESTAIVGEGWNAPEYEWGGCGISAIPNTDSWVRTNQRFGPLDASPQEIAQKVAAAWNALGYRVTVETDDTLTPPRTIVSYPPYLTGSTREGFGAVFSVGENYADFRGNSRCIAPYPGLDDRFPDPTTDQ